MHLDFNVPSQDSYYNSKLFMEAAKTRMYRKDHKNKKYGMQIF